MAQFLLLSGRHCYGSQKNGNRVVVKPGEVFETSSEKETQFCKKYPDRYQEVRANAFPAPVATAPPDAVVKKALPPGSDPESHIPQTEEVEVDFDKLKNMNLRELLTFCRDNAINLSGPMTKESVLEQIDKATKPTE